MASLSVAAVFALAQACQSVVAPSTIVGIAQHESSLDPKAVHINPDGSRDRGLMQINEKNDRWLGLTDPFDPCQSIAAAARLLASYSRYNTGSQTAGISNGYAIAVNAAVSGAAKSEGDKPEQNPAPDPVVISPGWRDPKSTPPSWDVWGSDVDRQQSDAEGSNKSEDIRK